jgi:hypothetical protein
MTLVVHAFVAGLIASEAPAPDSRECPIGIVCWIVSTIAASIRTSKRGMHCRLTAASAASTQSPDTAKAEKPYPYRHRGRS